MIAARLALHDLHAAAGALFGERDGFEVPLSYGDGEAALLREYAAGGEAAGLVDLSDRALLAVSGPLRQKFLHGILSNDVNARQPGQGCRAALMDTKGHLLAVMRVLVGSDLVWVELPATRADLVERTFVHYRVAAPVRFARPAVTVLGLVGPAAAPTLGLTGEPGLEDHLVHTLDGHEVRVARAGDLPSGFVLHVPAEAAGAVWDVLSGRGAVALGRSALDALRVEAGRPWYGPDMTEDNLLHETGLVRELHSPTKGCYVGQEIVARLEGRGGRVNKMMRGLQLGAPAEAGAPLTVDGKEVGRVTTAARSPRRGPIALAYVHRSHFEPGTGVEVLGAPATVVALPFGG